VDHRNHKQGPGPIPSLPRLPGCFEVLARHLACCDRDIAVCELRARGSQAGSASHTAHDVFKTARTRMGERRGGTPGRSLGREFSRAGRPDRVTRSLGRSEDKLEAQCHEERNSRR